jgi:hypothetical protein
MWIEKSKLTCWEFRKEFNANMSRFYNMRWWKV